jgi:hypothetical protein
VVVFQRSAANALFKQSHQCCNDFMASELRALILQYKSSVNKITKSASAASDAEALQLRSFLQVIDTIEKLPSIQRLPITPSKQRAVHPQHSGLQMSS